MSITTAVLSLYLCIFQEPKAIFGKPENRILLLARAAGGFVGVFGFYCEQNQS